MLPSFEKQYGGSVNGLLFKVINIDVYYINILPTIWQHPF